MSWQAVAAAKRHRVGSATWKAVLLCIADHCDPDGTGCTARYATIAEEAECSLRIVKTIVPALLAAGVLTGRSGRLAVEMDDVIDVEKVQHVHLPSERKVHDVHQNGAARAPRTPDDEPRKVHLVHPKSAPGAPPSKPTLNRPKEIERDAADFEAFWKAYPRHASKGQARRAWKTALGKTTAAELIAGAERYRDDPKRNPDFTRHPATWLNGEGWLDQPAQPPRARQHRFDEATGALLAPGVG